LILKSGPILAAYACILPYATAKHGQWCAIADPFERARRKHMSESNITQPEQDGRADFDFFMGTWNVHHRRLCERLNGSDKWETFEGICVAQKVLGGLANMDEATMERPSGLVRGMTVRLFDPKIRQWSLYWADSVNGWNWHLPQIGVFKDGVGEFYAHEPFGDQYIFSRYIWSRITPTTCRWEQAFSADGGRTWETNWIMDNERIA
jgi:hypothetical protein